MTVQILLFDAARARGARACVVGLALGELLSLVVFHATPGYLSFAFPVGNERIVTWQSVALSIGAGLAAAVLGVLWPLRDVLMRPLQSEQSRAGTARRWIAARLGAGLGSLGLTTLISARRSAGCGAWRPDADRRAGLPVAISVRRACHGLRGAAASVQWGLADPRGHRVADSADAGPLAGDRGYRGDRRVRHRRGPGLADKPPARSRCIGARHRLQRRPVGGAEGRSKRVCDHSLQRCKMRSTLARLAGCRRGRRLSRQLPGLGEPPTLGAGPAERQPAADSPRRARGRQPCARAMRGFVRGSWAVLSQALAAEHDLHIGQQFTLPAPRPTSFRVAALSTNLGWPPGAIILSSAVYARAWASGSPSAYEIQAAPGIAPGALRGAVQRALGPHTGLSVETAAEREQLHYTLASPGSRAAYRDPAARVDRRSARRCGCVGLDDLAAPRSRRVHQVRGLSPWCSVALVVL